MTLPRAKTQFLYQYQAIWKKYLFFLICSVCLMSFIFFHQNIKDLIKFTSFSSVSFEDIRDVDQSDPNLIRFIRDNEIIPPSDQKYNLTNPEKEDFSQYGQGLFLREYFRDKVNGTFIEAGAWDGEFLSNTLILERQLGWTGLLIEPNPQRYPQILPKHRKAYASNSCISVSVKPTELYISLDESVSHIIGYYDEDEHPKAAKVNCYPIYSLMAAVNMTSLDLMVLDLESLEVKVVETIPWEKVDIKSLLIEVNHLPEGKEYLIDYLANRNYILKRQLKIDYFFVKKY